MKRISMALLVLMTLAVLPPRAHSQIPEEDARLIQIEAVVTSYGSSGKKRWLTYGFSPNVIEVAQGQKVILELTSRDGQHSLAIRGLGVHLGPVRRGETARTTFVADKAGEFEIVCDATCEGDDRRMPGRLIVEGNEE
jgi:heme/copper-type cytochrome/quinol oxidase subunit 2